MINRPSPSTWLVFAEDLDLITLLRVLPGAGILAASSIAAFVFRDCEGEGVPRITISQLGGKPFKFKQIASLL